MNQDKQGGHSLPGDGQDPQPVRHFSARSALFGVILLLLVAAVVVIAGIVPRVRARAELKDQTDALAAPDVAVQVPTKGKPINELVLPGNVYAFTDSPIYARTNGYLEKWFFDIGAHVRKGQLLAIISTPELDQQLSQARADLVTAQANASLAQINAKRYQSLLSENAVSRQSTDTFVSQQAATSAAVNSAQANVQRLEELQSFEKVYAPFDGVITARNVDVGQLINAGAGTQGGTQMFHMAAINVLRIYVNVPQVYSAALTPAMTAGVTFSQFPNGTFTGKLVRTSNAIDPASRTLLAEFDVDNRDGKLTPGSFAEVHIGIDSGIPRLIVPVSALLFRSEGLRIATAVKGPNGEQAKLVPVTLGEDDGTLVEVVSGLTPDSRVIQNPPDSLIDGEAVRIINSSGGQTNDGAQRSASKQDSGQ